MTIDHGIQEITDTIIKKLHKNSDPQRRQIADYYYPTSMVVIGVAAAPMKEIAAETASLLKSQKDDIRYLKVCKALVGTGIFECVQVAFLVLDKNKTLVKNLSQNDVEDLGKGLDNWVTVDTFSTLISGVAWREGNIPDREVLSWLESDDPWRRRVAVVCTIAWNQRSRGGTGNAEKTLMICEKVVNDRHDMVQKALSWALRELSKRDTEPVEAFMDRHWDRLPGRVRREVSNKLKTGRKGG